MAQSKLTCVIYVTSWEIVKYKNDNSDNNNRMVVNSKNSNNDSSNNWLSYQNWLIYSWVHNMVKHNQLAKKTNKHDNDDDIIVTGKQVHWEI